MRDPEINAWHDVRGVTSKELQNAERETLEKYGDILDAPRPRSEKHAPMSLGNRAAQFAPFAALTGYDSAIMETGRYTEGQIELEGDRITELDQIFQEIQEKISEQPEVRVVSFIPDSRKSGGEYREFLGKVKKIDPVEKEISLVSGEQLLMKDIIDITVADNEAGVDFED